MGIEGRAKEAGLLIGVWAALASACGEPPRQHPPVIPPIAMIPIAPMPSDEETPRPSAEGGASAASSAPAAAEAQPPAPSNDAPVSEARRVLIVDEGPHYAVHLGDAGDVPPGTKLLGRHGRPYHPAPGIIVDVGEARGGASAATLQRVARNSGYWPFRRCYEEGLRRDQSLSGKVSLDARVSANGSVERSTVTRSTVRDESVAACVAREARRLPFAGAEAPTDATIEVTLATGDEPVPVARPIPDADRVRQSLRASWPAVEQCYASGLARRPDTGGRIELRFRISAAGEVTDVAELGETRFGDVDVTRCVLGVYRTASMPPLQQSTHERSFVYALHLEAAFTPPAQQ